MRVLGVLLRVLLRVPGVLVRVLSRVLLRVLGALRVPRGFLNRHHRSVGQRRSEALSSTIFNPRSES